jgi:hypothetical protein
VAGATLHHRSHEGPYHHSRPQSLPPGLLCDCSAVLCSRLSTRARRCCCAQDIEETVERDNRLRPGCSAAFSVPVDASGVPILDDGREKPRDCEEGLVVVAEVRNDKVRFAAVHSHEPRCDADKSRALVTTLLRLQMTQEELTSTMLTCRRAILQQHGVAAASVLLLRPHTARKVARRSHPLPVVPRSVCGARLCCCCVCADNQRQDRAKAQRSRVPKSCDAAAGRFDTLFVDTACACMAHCACAVCGACSRRGTRRPTPC